MIGHKFNNKKTKGQILLITIITLSIISTIILSGSFTSITETQLTKLEEENQKALSAAQAAIEASLKKGDILIGQNEGEINIGENLTGQVITNKEKKDTFITPLIPKYAQYTFYLSSPTETNNQLNFTNLIPEYKNKDLYVCSSTQTALHIMIIKKDNSEIIIKHYPINPPDIVIINNGYNGSSSNINYYCPSKENFSYYFKISKNDIEDNTLILIVKLINNSAKIGFKTENENDKFPFQGKLITSIAKSSLGVVKKINFFQSYPQIPAEFFITSF